MSEPESDARGRAPGWYPDESMSYTRRYWDGERWTDQVAPADSATTRSTGTENVASGVLKAVFLVLLVAIGVGILVFGFAAVASADVNLGVLAGVALIWCAFACVAFALRSSKATRKPRRPWAWWELAVVTGLGAFVLAGLVQLDQERQRDDKFDRIACESYERMYGDSGDC